MEAPRVKKMGKNKA